MVNPQQSRLLIILPILEFKLTEQLRKPIFGQCSHFIHPENNRKPLVFWHFQGVYNENIDQIWVNDITKDD